jgi:hypothetical protein
LEQKVYCNNPHTLADVNNFITIEICGYKVVNLSDIRLLENSVCGSEINQNK